MTGWESFRRYLPLHCSFFSGVDISSFGYVAEQIAFDVVEQERLRVRVGEIETVVVDDLRLFLTRAAPAGLADFCRDTLAELVGERRERKGRVLLTAVCAFDCVSHEIPPCSIGP